MFQKMFYVHGENVKLFILCWSTRQASGYENLSVTLKMKAARSSETSKQTDYPTHNITILYVIDPTPSCCRRARGLLKSPHVVLTTGRQDGGAQRERGRWDRHCWWAARQPADAGVRGALATAARDSSAANVSLWRQHWETQVIRSVNIGRQYTGDSLGLWTSSDNTERLRW